MTAAFFVYCQTEIRFKNQSLLYNNQIKKFARQSYLQYNVPLDIMEIIKTGFGAARPGHATGF